MYLSLYLPVLHYEACILTHLFILIPAYLYTCLHTVYTAVYL